MGMGVKGDLVVVEVDEEGDSGATEGVGVDVEVDLVETEGAGEDSGVTEGVEVAEEEIEEVEGGLEGVEGDSVEIGTTEGGLTTKVVQGGLVKEGGSGVKEPTQGGSGVTEGVVSKEVGGTGKIFCKKWG